MRAGRIRAASVSTGIVDSEVHVGELSEYCPSHVRLSKILNIKQLVQLSSIFLASFCSLCQRYALQWLPVLLKIQYDGRKSLD